MRHDDLPLGLTDVADLTGYSVRTMQHYSGVNRLPPPDGLLSGRWQWWWKSTILEWMAYWGIDPVK